MTDRSVTGPEWTSLASGLGYTRVGNWLEKTRAGSKILEPKLRRQGSFLGYSPHFLGSFWATPLGSAIWCVSFDPLFGLVFGLLPLGSAIWCVSFDLRFGLVFGLLTPP